MIGRSAGHLRGILLPLALIALGLSGTPALAQHGDGPATDGSTPPSGAPDGTPVGATTGASDGQPPLRLDDSLTAPLGGRDSVVWKPRETDVLSLGLEVVPSPAEGSFFESYRGLGGKLDQLDPTSLLSLTARIIASKSLRWTFSGGYMRVGFIDYYESARFAPSDTGVVAVPAASVTEKLDATVIPILGGVEWAPVRSQFTTYVGALAGVTVSSVTWTTGTRAYGLVDYRRPVTNVDGIGVSPAARIFAGVDLRFDYFSTVGGPFRGIYVEAAYLYLPLSRGYFEELRRTSRGVNLLPGADRATINAGGLSITFGVSVQFPRREKSG